MYLKKFPESFNTWQILLENLHSDTNNFFCADLGFNLILYPDFQMYVVSENVPFSTKTISIC